jgi:hypothetical protein
VLLVDAIAQAAAAAREHYYLEGTHAKLDWPKGVDGPPAWVRLLSPSSGRRFEALAECEAYWSSRFDNRAEAMVHCVPAYIGSSSGLLDELTELADRCKSAPLPARVRVDRLAVGSMLSDAEPQFATGTWERLRAQTDFFVSAPQAVGPDVASTRNLRLAFFRRVQAARDRWENCADSAPIHVAEVREELSASMQGWPHRWDTAWRVVASEELARFVTREQKGHAPSESLRARWDSLLSQGTVIKAMDVFEFDGSSVIFLGPFGLLGLSLAMSRVLRRAIATLPIGARPSSMLLAHSATTSRARASWLDGAYMRWLEEVLVQSVTLFAVLAPLAAAVLCVPTIAYGLVEVPAFTFKFVLFQVPMLAMSGFVTGNGTGLSFAYIIGWMCFVLMASLVALHQLSVLFIPVRRDAPPQA